MKKKLVMLVSDSKDDLFRLTNSFEKVGFKHEVHIVRSFSEFFCYLGGIGVYADRSKYPEPLLLLLDLDMAGTESLNILDWLRHRSKCPEIPAIGFCRHCSQGSVQAAFNAGLNGYFELPNDSSELVETIRDLEWVQEIQQLKEADGGEWNAA